MKLLIFVIIPFVLIYIGFVTVSYFKTKERDRQRAHELAIEQEKTKQSENISKHLE